jgi:hypothetical protein
MSIFEDLFPDVILSMEYHMNMSLILNGYGATDRY